MKRNTAAIVLVTALSVIAGGAAAAKPVFGSVSSPDGKVVVTVSLRDAADIKDALFWKVAWKNLTVMEDSRLGFTVEGAPALDGGFSIVKVERDSQDTTWKPPYGEASEYRDHYNEMRVTVRDDQTPPRVMILDFRAYDEGAAFRTTFPKQKAFNTLTIRNEDTQFRFTGDHQAWVTRNAQGKYEILPLSMLKPDNEYERPFVMKTAAGKYISILEAGNTDFARMRIALDKSAPHAVVSSLGSPCEIATPYSTPWRLVMPADNPGELLQRNYMLLNLSPPCRIGDPSWIKPGKQMRDVTITKKGGMAMIDLAAKLGLDYVEIDAGWYGDERDAAADATTVTPTRSRGDFTEQDLRDVSAYGKTKDIGLIVYVNRRALEKQLDEILPLYKKWGIVGMKFGFINEGPQKWTKWLHESLAKAAKYHMIVDAHDEYRPTGTERTYPNFLTAEGIRGNEAKPTPKQDLDTAFLRGMCGPADFTMCWHAPSLKMSWAHQMAASVVYYSPLQTLYWYDQPNQFTGEEDYLAFFRALPTVWDEKVVIQGEIGEFITLARRTGYDWFVGTMNAGKPRKANIPLGFLTPGKKYTATIYSDDPSVLRVEIDPSGKGKGNPESKKLVVKTMEVTSDTVIHADMANNGGQAIHILPANQDADAALLKKNGYRGLENPKSGLPKVLLVGDSICSGYNGQVRELLADKANVYVWVTGMNLGRGNIEEVQRVVLAAEDFDVVHFNIGLHGLGDRIPEEKYEPLLRKYVANYKKYAGGAHLIWGSITPVWEKETGKLKPNNAKIVKRNAIAERVMKENGIPVTRLYAAVIDKLDLGGGIHWSAKGYAIMAEAIAKNSEIALKEPRKKTAKPTVPIQKATFSGVANDSNIPVTARPVAKGRGQQNHHKSLNKRVKQGNVDIIFVGDSITHFWASAKRGRPVWEKYYAKRNAVNLGISGDRTQHVLWRLQNGNLEGISPKVAVVMIGTNNSGSDSPEDIAAGVKAIVDTIEEKCPSTRILILGIFPRGKDDTDRHRIVNMKANKIVSSFADNRTIFYLDISKAFLDENRILSRDIMPDLLHLNTKGYEIWAGAIDEKLGELMQN
ncbi:MAG: glycoside hydrolase family 97 N-terminal domain-containing protein [Pontiella sp.]